MVCTSSLFKEKKNMVHFNICTNREMSLRDFQISTNHPLNRYISGQTVRGKIHFKLHTSKIILGIYVRFKGVAEVKWEELHKKESFGKETTTYVTHVGDHTYFDENIYLLGAPDGDSFELAAGEHNYKFEYNLPVGLPTSFEGPLGNISYTVKAVLDIPWSINDETEIELEVVSPIDLNMMPQLKNPGYMTKTKDLYCLWCRSGPITIEVNIPKTGYAYGEIMHIRADIENLSTANITMLECVVNQKVTYHTEYPQHHRKEVGTVLCTGHFDGVRARSTKTYDKKLKIPDGPVANFNNCSLFNVEHSLKVKLYIDGCHLDLSLQMPITVGTIPLLDESTGPPVSVLAGLGTPYPYPTEQNSSSVTTNSTYLLNNRNECITS